MAVIGSLLNNYADAPATASKLASLDPKWSQYTSSNHPKNQHPLDAQQYKGLPWFAPSQERGNLIYVPSEHYRYMLRRFGASRMFAKVEYMHLVPCSEFDVSARRFTLNFNIVLENVENKAYSNEVGAAWYAFAMLEVLESSTEELLAVPSNISEVQEFRKILQEKHNMVFSMLRYEEISAWVVNRHTNHLESKSFSAAAQDVLLDILQFQQAPEGGWRRAVIAELTSYFPLKHLTDRTWRSNYAARCVLENTIATGSSYDLDYILEKSVDLGLQNILLESWSEAVNMLPTTRKVLKLNVAHRVIPPALWGMMVAEVSILNPGHAKDIINMMISLLQGGWEGPAGDLMQTATDAVVS